MDWAPLRSEERHGKKGGIREEEIGTELAEKKEERLKRKRWLTLTQGRGEKSRAARSNRQLQLYGPSHPFFHLAPDFFYVFKTSPALPLISLCFSLLLSSLWVISQASTPLPKLQWLSLSARPACSPPQQIDQRCAGPPTNCLTLKKNNNKNQYKTLCYCSTLYDDRL